MLNKRIRDCKFPELERILFNWHNQTVYKGVFINDQILIQKAKDFGNMINQLNNQFESYREKYNAIKVFDYFKNYCFDMILKID